MDISKVSPIIYYIIIIERIPPLEMGGLRAGRGVFSVIHLNTPPSPLDRGEIVY